MLLGLDAAAWTAIGANAQAIITLILIATGAWQVIALKRENMKSRTLAVCDRYDTDPVLDASLTVLYEALISSGPRDLRMLKVQAATVLNYLDSIAVGIQQGLYIEQLARDHLKPIVVKHVHDYLTDESVWKAIGLNRDDYRTLIAMADRWKADPPAYRDGFKWRRK